AVARDAAGNVTTSGAVTMTIDNTPPTVTNKNPNSGATGVSTSSPNIFFVFGEPVQPGTIAFTVKNAAGVAIPGTLTYTSSSSTATVALAGDLDPSATYTATVSGAKDLAGN